MRRLALVPLLLLISLLPLPAAAVGLGSIELNSALNQTLDAEIPLHGVAADDADEIGVKLASEEAFQRVGLQRPAVLQELEFTVHERGGQPVVLVTSRQRIQEPHLSFLVQVTAPGGSVQREYTILLDPPQYATQEAEPSTEASAEAATEEETAEPAESETEARASDDEQQAEAPDESGAGSVGERRDRFGDQPVFLQVAEERDRTAAEAEAQRRAADEERREAEDERDTGAEATTAETEAPDETSATTYQTDDGDTTWGIARRFAEGSTSPQQMMIALLRENPEAFVDGNVNRLRSGYVLRVPSDDNVAAISAQQAVAQIERQNTLWREWRDSLRGDDRDVAEASQATEETAEQAPASTEGSESTSQDSELRIVGSSEGGEISADDEGNGASDSDETANELQMAREELEAARLEKEELESRVSELESTVQDMERLITVREEQLQALQQRLVEIAEEEDVELDPEMLPDEDLLADDERAAADIEIVTLGDAQERLAAVADEQQQLAAADTDSSGEASASDEAGAESAGSDEESDGETASADSEDAASDEQEDTASAADGEDAAGEAEEAADEETSDDEDDGEAVAASDGGGDTGVQTERTQPGDDGLLSRITGPITALFSGAGAVPGGPLGLVAIIAIVGLLIGLVVYRRRQQQTEAFEAGDVDLNEEYVDQFDDLIAEDSADTELDSASESGVGSESASAEQDDDFASPEDAEAAATSGLAERGPEPAGFEPHAGAEAGSEDTEDVKDDTIFEADLYLSYGLSDQAREVMEIALQESPERGDYREKLLETLYAMGDREAFEREAERLQQQTDTANQRRWPRVAAMGQVLAPDNPMFQDADTADVPVAAGQSGTAAAAPDFELGEANDTADTGSDTDLDFAFLEEDFEPGEDAGGGTTQASDDPLSGPEEDSITEQSASPQSDIASPEESPAGSADDLDIEFDLGDLDELGSEEQASAPTHEDEPRTDTGGSRASEESDGNEFDLDDLDFLTAGDEESGGDEQAPAAQGDDDLDLAWSGSDAETGSVGGAETTSGSGESADSVEPGEDSEDILDMEDPFAALDAQASRSGSAEQTDETAEFDLADLEADAGDIESDANAGRTASAHEDSAPETVTGGAEAFDFDLDEDLASTAAGPVVETKQPADSEPGSTGDETPAGQAPESPPASAEQPTNAEGDDEDELETMLDLAEAYIELGDQESAVSALEEVASAGTAEQRSRADKLLESARASSDH